MLAGSRQKVALFGDAEQVGRPAQQRTGDAQVGAKTGIRAGGPGRHRGSEKVGLGGPVGGLDPLGPCLAGGLIAGGERVLFAQRRGIAQDVERRALEVAAPKQSNAAAKRASSEPCSSDVLRRCRSSSTAPRRSASWALYSETAAALRAWAV
jgi:hypothetical protein